MGGASGEREDREPGRRRGADTEARAPNAAAGFLDPRRLCHAAS